MRTLTMRSRSGASSAPSCRKFLTASGAYAGGPEKLTRGPSASASAGLATKITPASDSSRPSLH